MLHFKDFSQSGFQTYAFSNELLEPEILVK